MWRWMVKIEVRVGSSVGCEVARRSRRGAVLPVRSGYAGRVYASGEAKVERAMIEQGEEKGF